MESKYRNEDITAHDIKTCFYESKYQRLVITLLFEISQKLNRLESIDDNTYNTADGINNQ